MKNPVGVMNQRLPDFLRTPAGNSFTSTVEHRTGQLPGFVHHQDPEYRSDNSAGSRDSGLWDQTDPCLLHRSVYIRVTVSIASIETEQDRRRWLFSLHIVHRVSPDTRHRCRPGYIPV